MVYSKLHQQKNAFKLEIDITRTRCPICNRRHLKINNMGEITCTCGYINSNIHLYVAGFRVNNDLPFHIKKIKKAEGKE